MSHYGHGAGVPDHEAALRAAAWGLAAQRGWRTALSVLATVRGEIEERQWDRSGGGR